ncbi:DinB family protein [Roseivirga sp. BDSF3-8]|uniref:DinB family protein n=1 Tax=Roseivirga sp. BDSF3-8 TaxID=3241598 RepID=UPI003531C49C
MKINSHELLAELTALVNEHLERGEGLLQLPEETLNRKPDVTSWSTLECLEHMNLYGDHYLPEMKRQIGKSRHNPSPSYRPGWFGNWFAGMMQPKEKLNKMKTFKSKDPWGSTLDKGVVGRFIEQQKALLGILQEAKGADLGRVRVPMTIPLMRVKLGDTLRFFVNHNERHMRQVERVLIDIQKGHSLVK